MSDLHDDSDHVRKLIEAAEGEAQSGRDQVAHTLFVQAIAADPGSVARNAFGIFLVREERFPEAIDQFLILLSQANREGNAKLRAAACNNLAVAYRSEGQHALAAQWQQRSITAESETGDLNQPSDLTNRANDAIVSGDYALAEQLLDRAIALEAKHGSLEGVAIDSGNLGILRAMQGEYQDAGKHLWRAYQLHRELNDELGAGHDLLNLAEILQVLGLPRSATLCLRRAIRRFENGHAPQPAARARIRLKEVTRIAEVLQRDPRLN